MFDKSLREQERKEMPRNAMQLTLGKRPREVGIAASIRIDIPDSKSTVRRPMERAILRYKRDEGFGAERPICCLYKAKSSIRYPMKTYPYTIRYNE
jgi:hypothetical protein